MSDRFDLEQGIIQCWGIVDSIRMLNRHDATKEDFESMANFYNFHFEELWKTFETMSKTRQFVNNPVENVTE
jgi:hypothetical protein